ncbi:tyrosine-type recombinase/integrase [Cytobacillus citreus]|uniref:tyrosine-type recombinase/integrase n=1 Tax=Cytobacillus citreus TaxID=2833586 RepID=UPI0023DFFCA5|nr:tyrosine-type recombinase/integrase [Cytobacillus citreus]
MHPHRLRHTFATELLAKGADLSFIGDELGHSDVSTTQIYARLPKREIITLYRKYMG